MDALATLICLNPAGELNNTREGQLIFFFQFLHAGGRWDEFLRESPESGDRSKAGDDAP